MSSDLEREIGDVRRRGERVVRLMAATTAALASRLRSLHRVALALAAPFPPGRAGLVALVGSIAEGAREALGGAEVYVVLHEDVVWRDFLPDSDPEEGHLVVCNNATLGRRPQRAGGPVEHVLSTGEAVYVPDIGVPSPFGPFPSRAQRGVRALAVVPLRADGRVLGAFSVDFSEPKEFNEQEREALDLFAAHAGAALERVRVLSDVRRREERFRALVEHSHDATMLVDRSGRIGYVSPGRTRLLGYEPEERLDADAFDTVHPDDAARFRRQFAALIERPGATGTTEVRCRHEDGSWRWIEATGTNLLDERSVGAVVVNYRDVSARKHAEEQHAARLRLDGALLVARTVAHALNNALSPVAGYAGLLASRPEVVADPQLARQVEAIAEAAEQAADFVRQLQRITRLEEYETPLGPAFPLLDIERSIDPAGRARYTERAAARLVGCG